MSKELLSENWRVAPASVWNGPVDVTGFRKRRVPVSVFTVPVFSNGTSTEYNPLLVLRVKVAELWKRLAGSALSSVIDESACAKNGRK